ncbi:MAG: TRAP transporter large permease subunit, partial [Bacteroidetes bacterium]|nr:TRAP transporter large permease subunit [Bacteroidota bacterium]
VVAVGVNPIHFGVIMVMNMTMGLITPPLGINLFVAQSMDKRVEFGATVKWIVPLFLAELVILILVTYVPSISLGLGEWLSGFKV